MDKEKEIEDMAEVIREENERMFVYHDGYVCTPIDQAKTLNNAGYGNVKQAVKEFAGNIIELFDEMGMERSSEYNDGYDDGVVDCITNIKSRLTELYGADE